MMPLSTKTSSSTTKNNNNNNIIIRTPTIIMLLCCLLQSSTTTSSSFVRAFWHPSTTAALFNRVPSSSIRRSLLQTTTATTRCTTTTTTTLGATPVVKQEEETKTTEEDASLQQLPEPLEVSPSMDDVISLCKRRGLIFPSSEIYNGYAGFFDYGPAGVELKRNLKKQWWKRFVTRRSDVVGIDTSIIHHPETWKSSGHVDGFSDPMVDCKESKLRYRADQLFFAEVRLEEGGDDDILGYVCVQEANDDEMIKKAKTQSRALLKKLDKKGAKVKPFHFVEVNDATEEQMKLIPSPETGTPGALTAPRAFNLMFRTAVGAAEDAASVAYLRPETAQGIFMNFKNVQTTARMKIPFGIAQQGKAFRNEITPRNFIFRSREFEQMEVEYFIPNGDELVWKPYHEEWCSASYDFLRDVGVSEDKMDWDVHARDKLAHYAQACTDITFAFPFGKQELMGIAARGNYDLTQHTDGSGKSLDYFDEATKEKYIPSCIEPSLGVDRCILALICSAYAEDVVGGEKRSLLKFHPSVAPIPVAVFPLLKNKPALVEAAQKLHAELQQRGWNAQLDVAGAIGRRYRRADEVGVPYCVTVDFETIEQQPATVTVRDRDTTQQVRMPMDEVISYLSAKIDGYQ